MHGLNPVDPGRIVDWGKTSDDYAQFRPGPPPSFYSKLTALGVGLPGQRILDLGTGTGVLAREFALNGAEVSGIDIASGQIEAAKKIAQTDSLKVDFQVGTAERLEFADHEFDAITANQCWLYFDKTKVIPEVNRTLKNTGLLVTSHFSWLPRLDEVARSSEELILKYNPQWTAKDWSGVIPAFPEWAKGHFDLKAMFYYDEDIPFTRESWRGRIRACRGVGAALSPDEVKRFDEEHDRILEKVTTENFKVRHRIDAHFFVVR